MRCSYCYVKKDELSCHNLGLKDCKKAVDMLFGQSGDEKLIKFMGGEPLLKFGLLKKISVYAKEKSASYNKKLCLAVATNGTLLDKNKISFLEKFNFLIFLSVDGDKKTHDSNRRFYRSARSSYEEILLNIAEINSERIIANYVITPGSVGKLIENVEAMRKKGIRKINFRIDINIFWKQEDIDRLQSAFLDFAEFYIDRFRMGNYDIFSIAQIHEMLQKDLNYTGSWCNGINLAPDGRFYSCCRILSLDEAARSQYALGSLNAGVDNLARTRALEQYRRKIGKITRQVCRTCPLVKYCFCLISSYICCEATGGSFLKIFRMECQLSKILISAFLKIISTLDKEHNAAFADMYLKKISANISQ